MDFNETSLVILANQSTALSQTSSGQTNFSSTTLSPMLLCHPSKVRGTKEAGRLFYTIF